MRFRRVTRSIVALITSLGLVACGGAKEDAQPFDRSADESAVDQGQEAESEEDPSDAAGEDDDAMMSMDYGRITPILVSALQDAHRKIDELAAEIAELKAN